MKSHRIAGLVAIIFLALAPWPALAAGEATARVSDLASKAIATVNDKALSASERQRQLGVLVKEGFDLPRMARFVLGRYWQGASDADRAKFTGVFGDYLVQTYAAHLDDYSGDSFHVVGEHAVGESTTLVNTDVARHGGGSTKVDWRVVRDPDGYKISDISVAGVSLAITQREEFATSLQRGDGQLSGLIDQLKARTTQAAH